MYALTVWRLKCQFASCFLKLWRVFIFYCFLENAPWIKEFISSYLFTSFLQCWGLNSGPHFWWGTTTPPALLCFSYFSDVVQDVHWTTILLCLLYVQLWDGGLTNFFIWIGFKLSIYTFQVVGNRHE